MSSVDRRPDKPLMCACILAAARLYLRARRLQKEIAELKERRRIRAEQQLAEVLR